VIYRCLVCQHEEARGCLPTVTCGLYFVFLLGLSAGCLAGVARGLHALAGDRPHPVEPPETPWWVFLAAVAIAPILAVVGMMATKFLLELIEYLAFARRQCPTCGGRRWSWGFTRGFGL
jgi:hypothetical protein